MTTDVELAEVAGRYRRLRKVCREQNHALTEFAATPFIKRAARKLGLWHQGTLVFDDEDDVCVLMDYMIYDCCDQGVNTVQRYAREHPPPPGSDEEAVLRARQRASFALFEIEQTIPGVGVRGRDLLTGREHLLTDIGLSYTGRPHLVVAARLVPFDGFVMTSGAPLPLDDDLLEYIWDRLTADLGDDPAAWSRLSRKRRSDLTGRILRIALAAGASEDIEYADAEDVGTYVPTAPIAATPTPGRNSPCPCGSGRKYKKCCGA